MTMECRPSLKFLLCIIIHKKEDADLTGMKSTTDMAMKIGQKALEKQLEIMEEQQQKAGEFVDKKVKTC